MNIPYDREAALSILGNDEALLAEIGGIFIADWPEYRAMMHAALAAGDIPALRYLSHTLKGLVAYFAAETAILAVRDLEHFGRDEGFELAPQLLSSAISAIDELVATLRTERGCPSLPSHP